MTAALAPQRRFSTLKQPPALPRDGSLPRFDPPRIHWVIEGLARRYGTPFRVNLGKRSMLVIDDPAEIGRIMRARPGAFRRVRPVESVFRELGIAGLFPDLIIDLFNACRDGDYEKARRLTDELAPMSHYLYSVPPRSLRHVRTKAALKKLGIIACDMAREPLLPLDEAERHKLDQAMRTAGLI